MELSVVISCSYKVLNCTIVKLRGLLLISAVCLALFSLASPAFAKPSIGTIDGMVISVSDGNHLTFSNNGTEINVHLYGIEAPVITKIRRSEPWLAKPGQRFAGRSFMALAKKVLHKQARLEIISFNDHDQAVAIIFVETRNINLEMVAEGWAWASQKARKLPDGAEYLFAEEQARSKKLGLWIQDNPQPPWEFRKTRKVENRDSW
jgi:endonuclease YncB( thermonuclease family)